MVYIANNNDNNKSNRFMPAMFVTLNVFFLLTISLLFLLLLLFTNIILH